MHVRVCSWKNVIEYQLCDSDHVRVSFVSEKSRNWNLTSQKHKDLKQTVIQSELMRHDILVNTRKMKKTEMCCKYLLKSQYFTLIKMLCEWKAEKKTRKTKQNNRKWQRNSQNLSLKEKKEKSTKKFQSFLEKKLL